jgi:hypothetical protein
MDFFIPEMKLRHRKRPCRAFCITCDEVYRIAFGLVIEKELQQLADIVQESNDLQNKRLEYSRALSALSTFTHVTDAKLQALSDIAETLNKRSMSFVAEAHKRAFQLTQLIVLLADVSSFQTATHHLFQLEGALEFLNHGF